VSDVKRQGRVRAVSAAIVLSALSLGALVACGGKSNSTQIVPQDNGVAQSQGAMQAYLDCLRSNGVNVPSGRPSGQRSGGPRPSGTRSPRPSGEPRPSGSDRGRFPGGNASNMPTACASLRPSGGFGGGNGGGRNRGGSSSPTS
jgi:hypothetical protein